MEPISAIATGIGGLLTGIGTMLVRARLKNNRSGEKRFVPCGDRECSDVFRQHSDDMLLRITEKMDGLKKDVLIEFGTIGTQVDGLIKDVIPIVDEINKKLDKGDKV